MPNRVAWGRKRLNKLRLGKQVNFSLFEKNTGKTNLQLSPPKKSWSWTSTSEVSCYGFEKWFTAIETENREPGVRGSTPAAENHGRYSFRISASALWNELMMPVSLNKNENPLKRCRMCFRQKLMNWKVEILIAHNRKIMGVFKKEKKIFLRKLELLRPKNEWESVRKRQKEREEGNNIV